MRLSLDELRRGLVRWVSNTPITLSLITEDADGVERRESERLADPSGTVVNVELLDTIAPVLHFGPWNGVPLTSAEASLERMRGARVETRITPLFPQQRSFTLRHVPGFGFYHRLVLAADYANWPSDTAVLAGEARVRLITGDLELEILSSIDKIVEKDGQYSLEGVSQDSVTKQGRFVEIIAPGPSRAEAEFQAYATRGLLALLMGHQVAGEVVSSEAYCVSRQEQLCRLEAPAGTLLQRTIDERELALLDGVLPRLRQNDDQTRAVNLALRWFERGFTGGVDQDSYLSYFIATETIISTHAKVHGPIPVVVERREQFAEIRDLIKGQFSNDDVGRVTNALQQASNAERFAFYARRNGLDEALVDEFKRFASLRNDIVHGVELELTLDDVGGLRDLLVVMLKCELGIQEPLPWESFPHIYSHIMEFAWKHAPGNE